METSPDPQFLVRLQRDFKDGKLVEYYTGCNTDVEFGRGRITKVDVNGTELMVYTDGAPHLRVKDYKDIKVSPNANGVYHIEVDGNDDFNEGTRFYAVAPHGVEIEKKPNWLEVSLKDLR